MEVTIIDQALIVVSHLIHNSTAAKDIYLFLTKTESKAVKPQAEEVEFYRWVDFDEVDSFKQRKLSFIGG